MLLSLTILSGCFLMKNNRLWLESKIGPAAEKVNLVYSPNGKLSADNSNYSDELLPYKEFLFQKLTLNKKVFSKLKVISKSYNWDTGKGEIEYGIKDKDINKFLHLDKDEEVTMAVTADNNLLSDGNFFLPIWFYQNQPKYRHTEGIVGSLEEENND